MLRKTLSFVLVLALALSLVGCGGAASSSTPASISTTSTNSASGNVDGSDAEPVTLHVLANSTALPENMFDFLVEGYMEHFPTSFLSAWYNGKGITPKLFRGIQGSRYSKLNENEKTACPEG